MINNYVQLSDNEIIAAIAELDRDRDRLMNNNTGHMCKDERSLTIELLELRLEAFKRGII